MNRWLMLGVAVIVAAAVAVVLSGGGGESHNPSAAPEGGVATATGPPASVSNGRIPRGRIVGFVRDVDGNPVPGARVRLVGGRGSVRAGRSGRFSLRARPGRRTVVAEHRWYARQAVATSLRHGRGSRVDFSLAVTAPDRVAAPNSADRMILWTGCEDLAALRAPELRRWIARGVDGFVCQTNRLFGLGGAQRFAGRARPAGAEYRLQDQLRASPAVRLARDGKLVLYLGFKAVNYYNTSTPFVDWFDDRGWSRKVLPAVADLAAAARSMGFAGLAIDQELYPQTGGATTASWAVRYPGNHHSEAQVRAKVAQRGRQLMRTMVAAYPGLELVGYATRLPESWDAHLQATENGVQNAFADEVQIDLWNGLSSVQGYSAIRWIDAVFYKGSQSAASWDIALQYNADRLYSYLSRRFSNWSYASSRVHVSLFSWINPGPKPTQYARDPAAVAEQLDAFRRWGAGGVFANYVYGALGGFDYGPYENGMRRASTPARVDRQPPSLSITSAQGSAQRLRAGTTVALSGVANDDFAIRAVRWYDDRGRQGVARLNWAFTGDEHSGWKGEMRWAIDKLRVPPDARWITVSAEDIHGLARQRRLGVVR